MSNFTQCIIKIGCTPSVEVTPKIFSILIALYCADFDVSEKKFTEIVDFCVAIDVFFIDKKNQKLTSPDLKEYLEGLLNFRERDRNRKANNHSHQIAKIHMENENIHMENGQSIEENSKGKNSVIATMMIQ